LQQLTWKSAGDCKLAQRFIKASALRASARERERRNRRSTVACLSLAFKSPCPDLIPKEARQPGFGIGGYLHPSAVVQMARQQPLLGPGNGIPVVGDRRRNPSR